MLLTIFMVKVSQTGCSAVAVTVGTTVLVLALKLMERQTLFVANNSVKLMAQKCKNYYMFRAVIMASCIGSENSVVEVARTDSC